MSVRTNGLLVLVAFLALVLGCDAPGEGWSGTEAIDEDVTRIQEMAQERIATGEAAPAGPADLAPVATAPEPVQEVVEAPVETEVAETPAEPAAAGPDAARGAAVYAQNCASCHGAEGRGDGPAGAALTPPATNHTDGSYMNPLSNDHLFKVVSEGGAAVGKSGLMAPFGGFLDEATVWDLVAHMRQISEPPYEGSVP